MEQLKEGQEIVFTIKDKDYKYKVWKSFLEAEREFNDKIFLVLKLDKVKFANSVYGYDSLGGDWPSCNCADFAALTRLVEALFPYCDKVTVDGKVVHSYSLFKPSIHEIKSESSDFYFKSKSSDIINFESIVQTSKIKLTFI